MRRPIFEPIRRWVAVGLLIGAVVPSPAFALPTVPRRAAADDRPDADVEAGEAEPDDADGIDADVDEPPPAAADAAPKRRPGARQIERAKPADDRLEDPEAARRAQWFGGMPGFPGQGLPFPMFPQPGFPLIPPGGAGVPPGGAGAAAGAVAGNATGFGFRSMTVFGGAGNALPGGNGFVVQTWVIGPDGQVIQQPPAAPEPKPGADAPKGGRRGAKPAQRAAGRQAPAKKAPASPPQKARVPRGAADGE